ncbi:DUF805 domain-containing protein [Zeaxanthinibacter sp. PT1]|uniref:DUF805 domain-containing protein n=1 Tax=Zeaxanthinibacter TaxID=561554 RepID=UPI00234BA2F1|nr:DUF805 domain-containing protein [Zeaxanthinibacter sp. PT1]MDC6351043.1 DUF805 domain-containing protein [Zeaxanthinibacter sp. PT1]
MNWYLKVISQYTDFTGRARRMEYWMFVLFHFIFSVLAVAIDNLLGITFGDIPYGWLFLAYALFSLLPGLAVQVRRLHDSGRSGWWILIGFVPLVGGLVLLVFYLLDSEDGPNDYGPNPKVLRI